MSERHQQSAARSGKGQGELLPPNGAPLYKNVEQMVSRRMADRELAPGAVVGTIADLAEELGVSIGTVKRGVQGLVRKGLVRLVRNRGIVVTAHGSGRCAYFPWQVDALFYKHSLPEHSELLAVAVEAVAAGGRQVTGDIPPQVEVIVGEQAEAGRTLIHLINYSGHQDRSFFPPIELRDLRVRLRDRTLREARSTALDAPLQVADDGTISLPSLGWMDVLVCR